MVIIKYILTNGDIMRIYKSLLIGVSILAWAHASAMEPDENRPNQISRSSCNTVEPDLHKKTSQKAPSNRQLVQNIVEKEQDKMRKAELIAGLFKGATPEMVLKALLLSEAIDENAKPSFNYDVFAKELNFERAKVFESESLFSPDDLPDDMMDELLMGPLGLLEIDNLCGVSPRVHGLFHHLESDKNDERKFAKVEQNLKRKEELEEQHKKLLPAIQEYVTFFNDWGMAERNSGDMNPFFRRFARDLYKNMVSLRKEQLNALYYELSPEGKGLLAKHFILEMNLHGYAFASLQNLPSFPLSIVSDYRSGWSKNDLTSLLSDEAYITSLTLDHKPLGTEGAMILASHLAKNKFLKTLRLERNNINGDGLEALAKALEQNESLKVLDLSENRLRSKDAKALASALQKNKSLESIRLASNGLVISDIILLLDALSSSQNTTLKTLDFSRNDEIGYTLKSNTVGLFIEQLEKTNLEELIIGGRSLDIDIIDQIIDAFVRNPNMKVLGIREPLNVCYYLLSEKERMVLRKIDEINKSGQKEIK